MIGFGHLPGLVMVLIFALIIFGPRACLRWGRAWARACASSARRPWSEPVASDVQLDLSGDLRGALGQGSA
jgi:hypothetical protein